MSFGLEQVAIGSRLIPLSNRVFLKRTEKSTLSYRITSSKDPDKEPFQLLRLPVAFTKVVDTHLLPDAVGSGGGWQCPLRAVGVTLCAHSYSACLKVQGWVCGKRLSFSKCKEASISLPDP